MVQGSPAADGGGGHGIIKGGARLAGPRPADPDRGGRLFTTHNFTHNTKHTYMLRLLAAVQRAGGPLPDAWLMYESSSRGKCHDLDGLGGHGRLLPTLVIAKLDGYGQCGILVPNPYFGYGDINDMWRLQTEALLAANRTAEERIPRVFWRGEVANHDAHAGSGRATPARASGATTRGSRRWR